MQPMVRLNLLIGGCMTAIGIILILIRDWLPQTHNIVLLSGVLISAGLLFVVISIFIQQGIDEKANVLDERILKIRAYTFMKAFLFSFTIVGVLGMLVFSGLLVIDASSAIMIIFLTVGLSSSLLSWYYNRQGDINGK